MLSSDGTNTYAQVECEDDACVLAQSRRFPAGAWSFGDRVARGKFSVSVVARNNTATYLLHNVGKSDGWRLEALPEGEGLAGMWASDEGGLWTWSGSSLRWRDTDAGWHDVALPEGFAAGSVAMSRDQRALWVSGVGADGPALFTVGANAPK